MPPTAGLEISNLNPFIVRFNLILEHLKDWTVMGGGQKEYCLFQIRLQLFHEYGWMAAVDKWWEWEMFKRFDL